MEGDRDKKTGAMRCTYTRTKIKTDNPLETKESTVNVLLEEPDDPELKQSIQRIHKNRFPEIIQLKEDYDEMEETTKI
ncbi:unnamed protein product [Brassicogethes aeneus]|uniref:Uncharacterized protein n=1 Tax=Brassicogethes aeneus TaxID=1431903 RepID=A0A9P0FNV2_BRAAE|nr:unnamed protein product [Brassicogethes aeneus]